MDCFVCSTSNSSRGEGGVRGASRAARKHLKSAGSSPEGLNAGVRGGGGAQMRSATSANGAGLEESHRRPATGGGAESSKAATAATAAAWRSGELGAASVMP